jgi:peptidoglycan/xylan/chitin deacetylase (PgdA/CDA1 family)
MKKFVGLMYHSLGDYQGNTYNIDINNFKDQIFWLKEEGYIVEGFRGFINRKGTNKWPERYALLSFDDGYKSFLKAADILNGIGFTGTFFVTKDWCKNRRNFLSDLEIKELGSTQEIGSHTLSHPNLTIIPKKSIHYELFESKKWIEDIIQGHTHSLSVPGGSINSKVIKTALEVGYKLIGNSKEWWNRMDYVLSSNVVNRVAIRRSTSLNTFKNIVNININFYLKRRLRSYLLYLPKSMFSDQQIRMIYKVLFS